MDYHIPPSKETVEKTVYARNLNSYISMMRRRGYHKILSVFETGRAANGEQLVFIRMTIWN